MKTVEEPSLSGGTWVKCRARFCQERGWGAGGMVGLGLPLWMELELDWRARPSAGGLRLSPEVLLNDPELPLRAHGRGW